MSADLPVLVVGAGPTGLALATELRRHGVRCRIVDRAADRPVHQARALTLWPGALDVLARHGIADEVVAVGLRMRASRYFSDGRVIATVRFGLDGGPVPVCEPQPTVERIQRARLACLGVAVEWRTELVDVRPHEGGVEVTLEAPGGTERLTAAWVVGCDGANSRVRELAGIAFAGSTYPRSYLLCDGDIAGDVPRDEVHYTLHRDGVLVVVPLSDGGLRVFADATRIPDAHHACPPTPMTPEQLQALVDERAPYPLTVTALRWSTRFQVHLRKAAAYRAGRILLAGDAAHIHSPAGGQGMNTGIQDAANLGWKLALVLRGVTDAQVLLRSYQAERAPIAEQVMRSSHQQTRMWGVRSALGRRIRDGVFGRMGRAGILERRVLPAMAQYDLDYHASPAVGAGGGRRAIGAGVPDVDLEPVRAGDPVSLRSLLTEPRHILLVWPGADLDAARAVVRAAAPLADRLRVLVIVDRAGAGAAADLPAVVAPDGHAPQGPLAGSRLVLVRPDGFVAAAAPDLDAAELLRPLRPDEPRCSALPARRPIGREA